MAGRHTDSTEETQFIARGSVELPFDDGSRLMSVSDVVIPSESTSHDLANVLGSSNALDS